MHLTTLTLHGFKSFGDRTTLEFARGITAVVGPNGSGKSNLIDALKWTSGGGRASEFRAGEKTDLIFHGAAGKRGLGYAEVEVELRGDGRKLHIFRSLHKDGSGKLRLNGRAARFLDIDEELAGSGLGRSSLAIIGQGEVSSVLMADPARLLGVVAEAAGVSRLAGRREQTVARLDDARSHLERLDDLMRELRRRLEGLEREADGARRHAVLTREELRLRFTVALRREDALAAEIERLRLEARELEGGIAAGRERLALRRAALEARKGEVSAHEEAYRTALAAAEARRGDLRVAEARLAAARERSSAAAAQAEALERDAASLARLHEPLPPEGDPQALEAASAAAAAALAGARRERETAEEGVARARRVLDDARERAAEAERQVAAFDSRRGALERQRDDLRARLDEGGDPDDAAGLTASEAHAEGLERAAQATAAELEGAREALEGAQRAHAGAEAEAQALERAALRSRQAFEARRGYAQGPRNALASGLDGVIGSVADLIRVPEAYREALAGALGRRSEYVVVDSADTGSRVLAHVRRAGGFVTVLPLELVRGRVATPARAIAEAPGVIGLASGVIDFDPAYAGVVGQLLGSTTLVESMEDATALARRHPSRPRLVTLEGDIVESYGAMSGGRRQSHAGVIGAAAELEEAEALAESSASLAAEALEHLREVQNRVHALRARADAHEQELHEARAVRARAREADAAREGLQRDRQARLAAVEADLAALEPPPAALAASDLTGLREELERAEARLRVSREREGAAAAADADARGARLLLAERLQTFEAARAQYARDLERRRGLGARAAELEERRAQLERDLAAAAEAHTAAQAALPRDLSEKEEAFRRAGAALGEAEAALAAESEAQAARGEALEACRLSLARREAAHEIAAEERRDFPVGVEPIDLGERACRSRLAEVGRELEGIGPVNHRAAQELERERARLEELELETTQAALAIDELAATLTRLDTETTRRLTAALATLREGFARHVVQLFGPTAEADIEVDSEEGRPVGLRIRLQPPGKQTRQLNLLSVGERTMGAMAFLFALMSEGGEGGLPIAVLDEVDAPLDEANIRRYCAFLTQLAASGTQFVLITHQKATFEVADALWGVTTEGGVSRVFSIARNEGATVG